jgi:hypothetical protein
MDVYLGGTRAGIETGIWLQEVVGAPVVFVTANSEDETIERIQRPYQERQCFRSPSIVIRG